MSHRKLHKHRPVYDAAESTPGPPHAGEREYDGLRYGLGMSNPGHHPAPRDPLTWLAAAGLVVGACAPALGDLLDGGEGDMSFVDVAAGVRIDIEEDGCEPDDGGKVCDYEATLSGPLYSGDFDLSLRYDPNGDIVLVEADDAARGTSFDDELLVLPGKMQEGDDERESAGGNTMSVELDEVGEEVEDAEDNEWGGCKIYTYLLGRRKTQVDVSICRGIGIASVDVPEMNLVLLRD